MIIAPLLLAAGVSPAYPSTEAYSGALPVQVASCYVVEAPTSIPGSYFGPIVSNTGTLNISFVNRDAKAITNVAFTVSDGTSSVAVVDKGTFSTGAVINHTFTEPSLTAGDVNCAVESVAFADGSTWPAQAAARRRLPK